MELQKLLKLIYDLTRKGRKFIWEMEQQNGSYKIKRILQKAPVFYTYQIIRAEFIYIQILVNLPQEVLYSRFRMADQN